MTCTTCGTEMKRQPTTPRRPYVYRLGGVEITLSGIGVYQCPGCGVQAPRIPRALELHRLIARSIVRKPAPLNGAEVRFLRQAAGFPSKQFAILIGVSPEYLSRVEHGAHGNFGAAADRLARLLVLEEPARQALVRLAAHLTNGGGNVDGTPSFRFVRGRWRSAA